MICNPYISICCMSQHYDGENMHFSLFAISIIYEAYKVNYYGKHPLKGEETKNRIWKFR